jgi:hypothetical protein
MNSVKVEQKDTATFLVLSSHLQLQKEGFLSSWTNSFVGPWDPSQGLHNPGRKCHNSYFALSCYHVLFIFLADRLWLSNMIQHAQMRKSSYGFFFLGIIHLLLKPLKVQSPD